MVPRALGDARTVREKLAAMPTDADIDFLFSVGRHRHCARTEGRIGATGPCGRTSTIHHRDPCPFWLG
ncbi:hypothetical protein DXA64_08210 [Collinsella sp. OF03-4AA]|nr:hypothetical protein DXA64_08210 [Collinsella sp. OF03-4AA]